MPRFMRVSVIIVKQQTSIESRTDSRMNGPHDLPQPIPYQGSKRQLAPRILRYFPPRFDRFVEPFAGSAAMSIAVASRKLCRKLWINDGHKPLIDLWYEILTHPDNLADAYDRLWNEQLGQEREFFNRVREQFNESHEPHAFLYLLARCVKAAIRYNAKGEFNNTPDNRRKGARPAEMRRRITHTATLLAKHTRTTSWDYTKVLAKCESSDLVYMDPPYQGVCGTRDNRYLPTVEHEQFCDQLDRINQRHIRYIVSYDGRTGAKTYGQPMPEHLNLTLIELPAGRSTQATLLGRSDMTFETLYLSQALASEVSFESAVESQLSLW